jgi:hypothetical protein
MHIILVTTDVTAGAKIEHVLSADITTLTAWARCLLSRRQLCERITACEGCEESVQGMVGPLLGRDVDCTG